MLVRHRLPVASLRAPSLRFVTAPAISASIRSRTRTEEQVHDVEVVCHGREQLANELGVGRERFERGRSFRHLRACPRAHASSVTHWRED